MVDEDDERRYTRQEIAELREPCPACGAPRRVMPLQAGDASDPTSRSFQRGTVAACTTEDCPGYVEP